MVQRGSLETHGGQVQVLLSAIQDHVDPRFIVDAKVPGKVPEEVGKSVKVLDGVFVACFGC